MPPANETLLLLQVCNYAKDWPNLKAIHDVAMDDLNKINEEAQKEMTKRLDERAKAKAEAEAKATAAAKAKAEAEARASQPRAVPSAPHPARDPGPPALDRPTTNNAGASLSDRDRAPTIHRPLEPEGNRG